MTLPEIYEAIAIEPGLDPLDEESRLAQPQDILDLCGSLVSVSEHGHLRLAHLSVRDYLTGTEIKHTNDLSIFALDPIDGNRELATCCLTYLSFKALAIGPSPMADAFNERKNQFPLLVNAAFSWTYFVRRTQMDTELRTQVADFISTSNRPIFMSWIQVINAVSGNWNTYPRHATPLYYAASFGLLAIVEDLVKDRRVKLDAPGSRFGGTALHAAVLRDHLDVMKVLLDAGADPNKGDFNGLAPLHSAASYGKEDVVEVLVAYGATIDIRTSNGRSSFDFASWDGFETVVKLLAKLGGSLSAQTVPPSQSQKGGDVILENVASSSQPTSLSPPKGELSAHNPGSSSLQPVAQPLLSLGADPVSSGSLDPPLDTSAARLYQTRPLAPQQDRERFVKAFTYRRRPKATQADSPGLDRDVMHGRAVEKMSKPRTSRFNTLTVPTEDSAATGGHEGNTNSRD